MRNSLINGNKNNENSKKYDDEDDDDNDDDDDDDDDLLLSYIPFSQTSSSTTTSMTTSCSSSSLPTCCTPDKKMKKHDDFDYEKDNIEEEAKRNAMEAVLPIDVTSPSQLFWYVKPRKLSGRYSSVTKKKRKGRADHQIHSPNSKHIYMPCRVCDPSEGKGLHAGGCIGNNSNSNTTRRHKSRNSLSSCSFLSPQGIVQNDETKVLIQEIDIPMGERLVVTKTKLVPYHNLLPQYVATTVPGSAGAGAVTAADGDAAGDVVNDCDKDNNNNDNNTDDDDDNGRNKVKSNQSLSSSSLSWCTDICHRLEVENTHGFRGKRGAKTRVLFLHRLLDHAKKVECEQEEKIKNSLSSPSSSRGGGGEVHISDFYDDEDSADDDHLEEPYTQNIGGLIDSNDGAAILTTKKRERLNAGDIITYQCHIYVAGDKRGIKTATVLSVNPNTDPSLKLDNGDYLPNDTQIRRLQTVKKIKLNNGKNNKNKKRNETKIKKGSSSSYKIVLEDHPLGIFRAIDDFHLKKDHISEEHPYFSSSDSTLKNGGGYRTTEAARVGKILREKMNEITDKTKEMGLPTDILHSYNKGIEKENPVKDKDETTQDETAQDETTKVDEENEREDGGEVLTATKKKVALNTMIHDSGTTHTLSSSSSPEKNQMTPVAAKDDELSLKSDDDDELLKSTEERNKKVMATPSAAAVGGDRRRRSTRIAMMSTTTTMMNSSLQQQKPPRGSVGGRIVGKSEENSQKSNKNRNNNNKKNMSNRKSVTFCGRTATPLLKSSSSSSSLSMPQPANSGCYVTDDVVAPTPSPLDDGSCGDSTRKKDTTTTVIASSKLSISPRISDDDEYPSSSEEFMITPKNKQRDSATTRSTSSVARTSAARSKKTPNKRRKTTSADTRKRMTHSSSSSLFSSSVFSPSTTSSSSSTPSTLSRTRRRINVVSSPASTTTTTATKRGRKKNVADSRLQITRCK